MFCNLSPPNYQIQLYKLQILQTVKKKKTDDQTPENKNKKVTVRVQVTLFKSFLAYVMTLLLL